MSDTFGIACECESVAVNKRKEYRIVRESNCVLIFGSIPLEDFSVLAKLADGPDAVADPHLARIAGANFAFGPAEDCLALAERYEKTAAPSLAIHQPDPARVSALSPEATEWLRSGNQGLSSCALFFHTTGALPGYLDSDSCGGRYSVSHPLDPSDLARCRRLYEQVPEVRERFSKMSLVSTEWAWLVEHWDDLCSTMDQEAPEWRFRGKWSAESKR